MQQGDAAGQMKPGPAGGAWIDKKPPLHRLAKGLVRMAEHHDVRLLARDSALERFAQRPGIDDVLDEEFPLTHHHNFRFPQMQAAIHVAQHRRDGRDLFQVEDHPHNADISRVQNMVHPRKQSRHFRVQPPVRVGNEANLHSALYYAAR